MSKQLTTEEIEQLRPQEGMTAEEFDKLRQNNQPSRAQQVRNGDILPVEKQEESKEESKPAAKREVKDVPKPETKEASKPAAKKTTTAKKTTARKTAAPSKKK